MARHKKLGIEACPKCGNLGRKRKKKIRDRPIGKYVKYWYFLHNDRSIRECYIENLVRPNRQRMTHFQEMMDGYRNFRRVVKVTIDRLMKLPLTDPELEELWSALEWVASNVVFPMEILAKVYRGEFTVSQQEREEMEIQLLKSIKSKKNMFGPNDLECLSLYEKYIVPATENRRKALNQKLIDSYNYPARTLPELTSG